jgi:AraC-like protein
LLERRPVFHSRNVDQTRAFLGAKEFRLDLDRRVVGHLDVRINGVFVPSMYVGYIQYGAPVSVGATPVDPDYWLQLPIRGDFETTVGRESVPCDALHGVLLSPLRAYSMRVAPASARLNLALKTGALTRQLAALLGDTPEAALDFAPGLKLAEGHGKSLARFTRLAVCEFDRVDSVLSNAITVSAFEQFVMTGLLLMLAEVDVAWTHGKLHEVETWHGIVAEGLFRKWLADFLPSRSGITSGYVVSKIGSSTSEFRTLMSSYSTD